MSRVEKSFLPRVRCTQTRRALRRVHLHGIDSQVKRFGLPTPRVGQSLLEHGLFLHGNRCCPQHLQSFSCLFFVDWCLFWAHALPEAPKVCIFPRKMWQSECRLVLLRGVLTGVRLRRAREVGLDCAVCVYVKANPVVECPNELHACSC